MVEVTSTMLPLGTQMPLFDGTVALVARGAGGSGLTCGRSDREGELGKRDGHPIKGGGVGGEFAVSAAQNPYDGRPLRRLNQHHNDPLIY